MKQALFFRKKDSKVECFLCRHNCLIEESGLGICGVRKNLKGKLYSLNYGQIVAKNIDPIEKKPFYHFLPGSSSYSIASMGCNFRCGFCQNWEISQAREFFSCNPQRTSQEKPEEIIKEARQADCRSISYTYTEPTVFFEFTYETAKLARENGLLNNFVTNGYISEPALKEIAPFLNACNVDLKSYSETFYRTLCGSSLEGVLETIRLMKALGIWIEITTLIIPGHNDSEKELNAIAGFISRLDNHIPWHISRFYPQYKLKDKPPTPKQTLDKAYKIGKDAGLLYIYLGNIYTDYGENTYCPQCNEMLIKREGYYVASNKLKQGKCPQCNQGISGIF